MTKQRKEFDSMRKALVLIVFLAAVTSWQPPSLFAQTLGTVDSVITADDEVYRAGIASQDTNSTEPMGNLFVQVQVQAEEKLSDLDEEEDEPEGMADPLESINRFFFAINDKLYFWLLKPVASGYGAVTPEPVRVGVNNFFYNLLFPLRFVNCILQGKGEKAADEMRRFMVNSSAGAAGFLDVASNTLKIEKHDEDLGQTLGVYGFGPGFFLNLPILGPSSLRDGIGSVGDAFLQPVNYLDSTGTILVITSYDFINKTSLQIGDYEALKQAAFDPYIAIRDAYHQNRQSKIAE